MLTRRAFLAATGIAPLTGLSRMGVARYDLIVKGGRVVDPSRRVDRVADVAVGAPELTPATLLRDGVTSMVDAGSAGADTIDPLVLVATQAPNRVRIFLNVARTGVTAQGELLDIAAADVEAARRAIARHRDFIVGIKVRLSQTAAGEHDLEAVRRARQAAGPLPVMLHVGQTFSPLPKILELREGDFEFIDNIDGKRTGHRKLVTSAVVTNGKRMSM